MLNSVCKSLLICVRLWSASVAQICPNWATTLSNWAEYDVIRSGLSQILPLPRQTDDVLRLSFHSKTVCRDGTGCSGLAVCRIRSGTSRSGIPMTYFGDVYYFIIYPGLVQVRCVFISRSRDLEVGIYYGNSTYLNIELIGEMCATFHFRRNSKVLQRSADFTRH